MALVVNDRVKETSTTTGTGTFDLAGAATGFQTFVAGVGDTNTTYYAIFNQGTTEWEVGLGTVTDAATDTLARTTVITSSNAGSAVDFAAGTKDVFCTLPASKAVFGKQEGTNFDDCLLVGHSTTGTLNAAQDNTGVGIEAMDAITSGDNNTAVGTSALTAVTSGGNNTGVGRFALGSINTTSNNTAVGTNAQKSASGGAKNTSLGEDSLDQVTGDGNIAIGYQAGNNITSGDGNVVIGNADVSSATGSDQLSISSGDDGSVVWMTGDSAGKLVATGGDIITGKVEGTDFSNSLLVGHSTTGTLDAATYNTGVGIAALDALTTGDTNTAIGASALTAVTTGGSSTGVGYQAGYGITGAPDNTIVGSSAFKGSATDANSGYNTVVGANAMTAASGAAFNTAIGRDAGREVTSGDYNVFLGYNAAANDSSAGITTGSGNVIIGMVDPASRTGNHQFKIANYDGSSTVTWIDGDSSGNLTFAGTATAAGGQLTTIGIALVMGF